NVVLSQSSEEVKKAEESLKLKCILSGFDVNSYDMYWYRKAPGKGLEWLVRYYSSSSNHYSPSIQGRFTASKDSSNFYLQMNSLRVEDMAMYYCARREPHTPAIVRLFSHTVYRGGGGGGGGGGSFHFYAVLTQAGTEVKKAGEPIKLKCDLSGFNVNSYWMYWYRQAPGKGLDWLVYYYTSPSYSSSIQGRFTASKESSNFYLQTNSLRIEDTAMYYCARRDTVRGNHAEPVQKPLT
uniref:Ig-like domain-containing protein n=1 Tax=Latimeria chalumnae TaxID=7897 RepID=H3AE85_LATCH